MAFAEIIDDEVLAICRLIDEGSPDGMKQLAALSEAGNKSAIVQLGLILSNDPDTVEESLKWLIIANDFGSADAAWNLAMIARERGDLAGMKRWLDRAADLGEEDAIDIRSRGYDVDSFLLKLRNEAE